MEWPGLSNRRPLAKTRSILSLFDKLRLLDRFQYLFDPAESWAMADVPTYQARGRAEVRQL
jgi:hypothetical protein